MIQKHTKGHKRQKVYAFLQDWEPSAGSLIAMSSVSYALLCFCILSVSEWGVILSVVRIVCRLPDSDAELHDLAALTDDIDAGSEVSERSL